jgi:hypothetical protein
VTCICYNSIIYIAGRNCKNLFLYHILEGLLQDHEFKFDGNNNKLFHVYNEQVYAFCPTNSVILDGDEIVERFKLDTNFTDSTCTTCASTEDPKKFWFVSWNLNPFVIDFEGLRVDQIDSPNFRDY